MYPKKIGEEVFKMPPSMLQESYVKAGTSNFVDRFTAGEMNRPLTVEEGLYLSNSLIKPGSKTETDVISYLKKRGQYSTDGSSTKTSGMLLAIIYWYQRKESNSAITEASGVSMPTLNRFTALCTKQWR